jgi:glycosyltransferase involved in cell wall biosynthesis
MKVLHVYAGNLFGGIETLLVTLARECHLCPQMEPEFALCFEGRLSQELAKTGVKVHQLGEVQLRNPWQVVQARAQLERVINENEIDAVICHACWPQVIFGGTVKKTNRPLLFWCHDTPKGTSVLEKLARFIRPDLVIANSKYTQQHLNLLYPDTPDRVVYYPVTPISIDSSRSRKQHIRQQLGTTADITVITQVSRLERWKGHSLTIAALGAIKDLDNWECWIVGGVQRDSERDYYAQLQQQVQQLGLVDRVRFLGERQDVPDLLLATDVFCQPNLGGEPFGIVFIEALYAGLPIVTVDLGGGGEIVTPACGYAVAPENIDEIAQALRELVQKPIERQQFRTAAVHRAAELCDPQQQLETLDLIISQLCQSKLMVKREIKNRLNASS